MQTANIRRRDMLLAAAATTLIVPFTQKSAAAWAAPSPTSGDWFSQVKEQHILIEAQLALIIRNDADPSPQRTEDLKLLSYLLTAHSVAEENVLYPALVFYGFKIDSGDLYLEQQFQKIMDAEINNESAKGLEGAPFITLVKALSSAIQEHAKVHEEGDYYPKLHSSLTAAEDAALSVKYRNAYEMVIAP